MSSSPDRTLSNVAASGNAGPGNPNGSTGSGNGGDRPTAGGNANGNGPPAPGGNGPPAPGGGQLVPQDDAALQANLANLEARGVDVTVAEGLGGLAGDLNNVVGRIGTTSASLDTTDTAVRQLQERQEQERQEPEPEPEQEEAREEEEEEARQKRERKNHCQRIRRQKEREEEAAAKQTSEGFITNKMLVSLGAF